MSKLIIFDEKNSGGSRTRGIVLESGRPSLQKMQIRHKITKAEAKRLLLLVTDILCGR